MNFTLDYTPEQEKFAKDVREWLDKNRDSIIKNKKSRGE